MDSYSNISAKSCAWEVQWPSMTLSWSEESYTLFELPKVNQISLEQFIRLVHPEDRAELITQLQESVKKKRIYSVRFRILTKGKTRFIVSSGVTQYDKEGVPIRTVGTFVDETHLVSEKEIVVSPSEFTSRSSSDVNDLVYVLDKSLLIRKLYGNIRDHFNIDPNQLLNKPYSHLFDQERFPVHEEAHLKVLKGEQVIYEWNLTQQGKTFHLQATLNPTYSKNGQIDGVLGVARDISALKSSKLEQNKLFQAIEHSPICVVITNTDGLIEYVNPYFEQLTGYSMQEVLGKKPSILKSGNQSEPFYQELWDTLLSGSTWKGIFKNKKKNGKYYWESAVITPITDDNGSIINFVALKQDISRQKIIQERLNRENEYKSSLLRSIPEVIMVFDNEGIIQDIKGENHYLGLRDTIRVGFAIWEIFDESNSRLIIGHLKQLSLRSEMRQFKIQIDHNKHKRTFEIRMVRINGLRYMLTATDITKSEEDFQNLKTASTVMKKQNDQLQKFSYTVSHHLRSHTANMEGIFNLIQIAEPSLMHHPFIELLKQSADQLSNTIQNLNDISDKVIVSKEEKILD